MFVASSGPPEPETRNLKPRDARAESYGQAVFDRIIFLFRFIGLTAMVRMIILVRVLIISLAAIVIVSGIAFRYHPYHCY